MKKQGILVMLLLAAVAALGVLGLLLQKPAAHQEETTESGQAADVIFDLREEEENGALTRIRVKNAEGSFILSKGEEGWALEGLEEIRADQQALHSLLSSVLSLKSVRDIEDGGERPADFGLTEKTASAVVEAGGAREILGKMDLL